MDLLASLTASAAEHRKKIVKLPRLLVCPAASMFPQDGIFEFRSVTTFADIYNMMTGKEEGMTAEPVLTFDIEKDDVRRLLELLVSYFDVFGYNPTCVEGVPGVNYPVEFHSITTNMERVSYHTLYGDIAEELRREKDLYDIRLEESSYARQQASETRRNGTKKEFVAFAAPTVDAIPEGDVDE